MILDSIRPYLVDFGVLIVTSIVAWASKGISLFIRSKVDKSVWESALLKINEIVFTTVEDILQTTVKDLKSAAEDGKLTHEEGAKLKQLALARVKAVLGQRGVEELQKGLKMGQEQLDEFLARKIESVVLKTKKP
jgi:hypothetical protein